MPSPPANLPRPVIQMRQVAIMDSRSPDSILIEEVTWTIAAGEYWAVGGLPASGKSDLLATAAGLQKPFRGFHELFGRDAMEMTPEELAQERRKIGIVFGDEGRLFQHLSISENIALPLTYHRNLKPADAA